MTGRTIRGALLAASVVLATAACDENPAGTDQLGALRVQGTVTSSPDDAPVVDMQVGLAWGFSGGGQKLTRTDAAGMYEVTLEEVFCVPGAFVIVGVIPAGFRLATSDDEPAGVECVEEIQTFDIQLEPIPD